MQVSMYRPRREVISKRRPEEMVYPSDSGELREGRMHQQRAIQGRREIQDKAALGPDMDGI